MAIAMLFISLAIHAQRYIIQYTGMVKVSQSRCSQRGNNQALPRRTEVYVCRTCRCSGSQPFPCSLIPTVGLDIPLIIPLVIPLIIQPAGTQRVQRELANGQ